MTHPDAIVTFTHDISDSQFRRWQPKTCQPVKSYTPDNLPAHKTDGSLAMTPRSADLPAVLTEFESSVLKMVNGHDYLARKRTELERRVHRLQVLVWLLLTVIMVILLTGCTATTPTAQFLATVDHTPGFEYDVVSYGYVVCGVKARGDNYEAFAYRSDPELVRGAELYLCPELF